MYPKEYHDVKTTPSPKPSTTTFAGITPNVEPVPEKQGSSSQGKKVNYCQSIGESILHHCMWPFIQNKYYIFTKITEPLCQSCNWYL